MMANADMITLSMPGAPQRFPSGGVIRAPPGLPAPPAMEAPALCLEALMLPTEAMSRAASPIDDSARPTQHLIWCHEFCHTAENKQRRQLIKKSFSEKNFTIHHMKKAVLFSKWLEETDASDEYLLVMGWREAQPCLRYIAQAAGRAPTMSVILCDGTKQFTRASNHVLTLSENVGPVKVCTQDDVPRGLYGGLIRECFGSLALSPKEEALPLVTRSEKRKISLQDELAKLNLAGMSDSASVSTGSGSATPTAAASSPDCSSPVAGTVNMHKALLAALERSGSGASGRTSSTRSGSTSPERTSFSSETSSIFVATPPAPAARHIGKGKGNGLPVTRSLLVPAMA